MARSKRKPQVAASVAMLPAFATAVLVYIVCTLWTVGISFTSSRLLPSAQFAGLAQYERLFANERWQISFGNLFLFGGSFLAVSLTLGLLMAIMIDQKVRGENLLRAIFLYPYAMSFVVTGLVWQWFLNPELGLQKLVRGLGWESFTFDWLINPAMVVFTLVIAAVWQASGLVMAIMLAGLRGVDSEIWKAARIDGIPAWRVYVSIVLPMLKPTIATAVVLKSITVVKLYDLVVAMTNGGPGNTSEVPAKFVMEYLFERGNIGLATAASTLMLITVLTVLAPYLYVQYGRPARAGHS
jgi:glucose/mannose transport system permease protein